MAVEVRELVIRAVVVKEQSGSTDGADDGCGGGGSKGTGTAGVQENMVQECVNQVLKILKKTNNR